MKRIATFLLGLVLALIVLMLASGCSTRLQPVKSEQRQAKFVTVWCVAGGIVIMWAIQDGNENREKK